MIVIRRIESLETLEELKKQYLEETIAPLDGIWLFGFISKASHFGMFINDEIVGFFCINDDGYMLQFYLLPELWEESGTLMHQILHQEHILVPKVCGAFTSTAEPGFLSLCFDHFPSFNVHSLMYQLPENDTFKEIGEVEYQLEPLTEKHLGDVVEFAKSNVRAPQGWLSGYYGRLISRGELFGLWQEGRLLAAGESRSDDQIQVEFGDVGLIVDRSVRGQGVGTRAMKELIHITRLKGLQPICSTEKDNIGAQKAITRAGFVAKNRIVQFERV